MKKIGRFLSSMPFAIALLILLAAVCAVCSAIPQGQGEQWYIVRFGEQAAGIIRVLGLDDAFHSVWFLALSGALCLSLLLCNLTKLPALMRRTREFRSGNRPAEDSPTAVGNGKAEELFSALHFPAPKEKKTEDGRSFLFSCRGTSGLWGHWICHLGILVLVVGFVLGQTAGEELTMYMLPGQEKQLGETGIRVRVDSFTAEMREDGSAEQYTTELTLEDREGNLKKATVRVNEPAGFRGYTFYQNSYGWGADLNVEKGGELLQTDSLCPGDFLAIKDRPELVLYLQELYPAENNETGAADASYLYRIYYQGQILGMNLLESGEVITVDDYAFSFGNPRYYTLMAVKRDPFSWLVLAGGIAVMAGLFLSFYVRPESLWAERSEEGGWRLYARSRRGGALFRDEFERAAAEAGFVPEGQDEKTTVTEGGIRNA